MKISSNTTLVQRYLQLSGELKAKINRVGEYEGLYEGMEVEEADHMIKTLCEFEGLCIKGIIEAPARDINDVFTKVSLIAEYESLEDILKDSPNLLWPKICLSALKDLKGMTHAH